MLEELLIEAIFLLGFVVLSTIIGNINRILVHPYDYIVIGFGIVGVIIHEISHRVMCVVTRTPVEHTSLLKLVRNKDSNKIGIGGKVILKEEERLSFLKAFLIGFAPAYICFWLFWYLWDQISNAGLNDLTILLCILLMCSLFLGAAPSLEDLRSIKAAFSRDVYHSLYQLALVVLSMATVWIIMSAFSFQVMHNLIIYLFIAIGYAVYRYSLMGLDYLWVKIRHRELFDVHVPSRRLTRRTHKPMKPKKLGIDEPHW